MVLLIASTNEKLNFDNNKSTKMTKIFTLHFLRNMAIVLLLIGALGSLGFVLHAGRNNNSVLLVALFVTWVLSPFIALLVAHLILKNWTAHTYAVLHCLMIFILPILSTTKSTFLVEIQKAVLSLLHQAKRKKALLASNLLGIT